MLGSPEFQRRLERWLSEEMHEQAHNLVLAKDWADFAERRGHVRALAKVNDQIHEITKQLAGDG